MKSHGPERLLMESDSDVTGPATWSPDAQDLLVELWRSTDTDELVVYHLGSQRTETYLSSSGHDLAGAVFSPDGRWVAYSSAESGRMEVYVASFPVPTERYTVSKSGGAVPRWRGDARELYFLGIDHTLFAAEVLPLKHGLQIGQPRALFRTTALVQSWFAKAFDVDKTGTRFVINTTDPNRHSDLVLVTNWMR